MKLLVAVFYVFAVLTFVGSVLGDEEGGASTGTGARVCPTEITDNKDFKVIANHVVNLAKRCFQLGVTNKTLEQLKEETSIEEYRAFFRGFCKNQEIMKECMDEIPLKLEVCENKNPLKVYQVFHDLLHTLLFETGCAQEGEYLASLGNGVMHHLANKLDFEKVYICGFRFEKIMQQVMSSNTDIPSKLFFSYGEIAVFDECFMSKEIDADFKHVYSSFVKKIVETMKCIHPQDGTLILCAAMDASLLTTPSVCNIIFPEGQEQPRYEILENRAKKCFEHIDQDLKGKTTGDMEVFSEYFNKYCTMTKKPWSCVETTVVYSEACLNETQYKHYELLGNLTDNALQLLCANQGERFAKIVHAVYDLKGNSTEEPNAVSECLAEAKVMRKLNDYKISLSTSWSFYNGFEVFKYCFLNKLQSDKTSVDDATTFMNELQRQMECIHPEDGTVGLCETIVNMTRPAGVN